MELLTQFIDIVLHLDQHLTVLIQNYGSWVYLILFLIIFCETGLVVTPFLPGDSLLFVAGALCATGALHVHGVFALLALAAFSGDNTNYWIGRYLGPRVFSRQRSRLFNPAHLQRTQRFYERHGGKTIVLARFMPIIRLSRRSWRASAA
jgi:membrane-associated protein